MSCTGTTCAGSDCTCGCCIGTTSQTPILRDNLPGLAAVAYRAGTWATFKESMLARLSSADYPALANLRTRESDDFTIALLDASALMLDVLTFYQERLVNESFLRTAGQLRSLTELSRLIGYQPSPGVAASTYVAFTLRAATGQAPPPTSAAPITIPAGTQMQSVPGQGQTPQTFETSADLLAKPDWSTLPVQTTQPWLPPGPNGGATSMYLAGTATQLQPGDALLFLGVDRETWLPGQGTPPEAWDIFVLTQVSVDPLRKLTYVAWNAPLIHENSWFSTPSAATRVLAFRQRASLFGHNAPNPNLFVTTVPAVPGVPGTPFIPAAAATATTPATPAFPAVPATPGTPATTVPVFRNLISTANPANWQWNAFQIPSATQIDLDAPYPRITAGSWFALLDSGPPPNSNLDPNPLPVSYAQLFRVARAHTITASAFTMSSKVTELQPDFTDANIPTANPSAPFTPVAGNLAGFNLATTEVLGQSDPLDVAPQPLTYPLYGTLLDLRDLRPDLTTLQAVALSGKRQKIAVAPGITGLFFIPADGSGGSRLHPGDLLTIAAPPPVSPDGSFPDWTASTNPVTLTVQDTANRPGTVTAAFSQFTLVPAAATDPNISEFALVAAILPLTIPYPHTRLQLAAPLTQCFDRTATTVNANVALVTNGSSVTEFLGSGLASTPNQTFTLKQSPLTYIPAITPTGRQSTLQVRVNGVAWTEVPSLIGQPPSQRVFATVNQPDGTTQVLFGDGVEGALLPTGQNNLLARYRIGLGSSGNVAANTLTTLIDRPLGVSGVTNPSPATGGQDPQTANDLRASAPLSVLTLGRAVSLADYESFATTFAGIARAHAVWIQGGPTRGLFLTVAGPGGATLPAGSPTLAKLVASLQNYGNPLLPLTVQSFVPTLFGLSADLQYDPAYDQPTVKAAVLQTLATTYSFAQRTFGQGVASDELAAVIQSVPGVVAVNVTVVQAGPNRTFTRANRLLQIPALMRPTLSAAPATAFRAAVQDHASAVLQSTSAVATDRTLRRSAFDSTLRLRARVPRFHRNTAPQPAEILLLDPSPTAVVLGVMS